MNRIDVIEKRYLKKELPAFRVGDVVDVQVRITEGDKERIQTFSGTVIGRKGSGIRETFTVRRIVAGEGVERVFPLHSPSLSNVIVRRPGRARRAKLYYLRERVGKSIKTKERREEEAALLAESDVAAAAEKVAAPPPKKDKKEKRGQPVASGTTEKR